MVRLLSEKRKFFALVIAVSVLVGVLFSLPVANGFGQGSGDILPYWAASRIFLKGGNPYNETELNDVVREVEPDAAHVMQVYAPPLVYSVIWYAGLMPFKLFTKLWFAFSFAAFFLAVTLTMNALSLQHKDRSVFFSRQLRLQITVFSLTFYPFIIALKLGQLVGILILGFSLFVYFAARSRDCCQTVLGGLGLALTVFKPQLLVPLYFFVIWESFRRRHFGTIIGLTLGSVFLALFPLLINPQIYNYFVSRSPLVPHQWKTPGLGVWLMILFGPQMALRYLPLILVVGALALFLFRHRGRVMCEDAMIARLVTLGVIVAPYSWYYDFVLLLTCGFFIIDSELRSREAMSHSAKIVNPKFAVLVIANLILMLFGPREMHLGIWYPLLFLALLVSMPQGTFTWRLSHKVCK